MLEQRYGHACGALPTGVRPAQMISFHKQALIVAGGIGSGSRLASVETLRPGSTSWTPLASLPRALAFVRASVVGETLWVTGGLDDASSRRSEVMGHDF